MPLEITYTKWSSDLDRMLDTVRLLCPSLPESYPDLFEILNAMRLSSRMVIERSSERSVNRVTSHTMDIASALIEPNPSDLRLEIPLEKAWEDAKKNRIPADRLEDARKDRRSKRDLVESATHSLEYAKRDLDQRRDDLNEKGIAKHERIIEEATNLLTARQADLAMAERTYKTLTDGYFWSDHKMKRLQATLSGAMGELATVDAFLQAKYGAATYEPTAKEAQVLGRLRGQVKFLNEQIATLV